MSLQWGTPTTPVFGPGDPVHVVAEKDLGAGNVVYMTFDIEMGWEGPTPTDADFLAYLGTLYDALVADGWTMDLRFTQERGSTRQLESV